jgi:hypothetical protein
LRIGEAEKLGFVRAAGPAGIESDAIKTVAFGTIREAADWLTGA